MKVAIFTDSFREDMGGGTKVVVDLAKGLQERGVQVLIVTGKLLDHTARLFHVFSLPSVRYPFYKNAEILLPSFDLIGVLREFDPDVIHYHDPFGAGVLATLTARYLGKRVVGTIHIDPLHVSYHSIKVDNGFMAKVMVGFLSRQSDAMIFVSHYQKETYAPYIWEDCPCYVIYPGIPFYFFETTAQLGTRRVITVSRLSPEKNLEFALEVMALVQKEMEVGYSIVGDGPRHKKLRKLAEKLGVRVEFMGYVRREDLPSLYSQSSLLFIPSKTETFGLVFAEAMACGLPVVALKAGAAPEVIGDGGVVCEEDPREVASVILALLRDPKLWMDLSAKAKQRAYLYNTEIFIEKHLELYKTISLTSSSRR